MTRSPEPLFFAKTLLEFLKFPGIKLNDFAALYAEHMIMMLMAEGVLIDGAMLTVTDLLNKAAFAHEGQSPVNGSPRGLHPGAFYLQIKVLGIKMSP
jgi:hypothetical protein